MSDSKSRGSAAPVAVAGVTSETICVAGGGLVGCMMALMLGRRGLPVRLIERRDDMRIKPAPAAVGTAAGPAAGAAAAAAAEKEAESGVSRLANSAKRSINLALSYRGMCALKHVDLMDTIAPWLVTMKGRYIHSVDKSVTFQPYGVGNQANYSISRSDLNSLLLTQCDKLSNISVSFDEKINSVDADGTVHSTKDGKSFTTKYRFVIGADGVFSSVRASLMRLTRMDYSQQHINACYKELVIPATASGDFALKNSEGLHIWSRHEFMLIALPNPDKTFTGTLFAPLDGEHGLNSLTDSGKVLDFFNRHFPDVVPVMPNLISDFFASPTSPLLTVRCSPWNHNDKIVIMGDAAHAIVPFYGQGMNSGFEDCLMFDELWTANGGDPAKVLPQFAALRKPSTDALADLSYANFKEMASHTASATFLAKKKFESVLYQISPSLWTPLYTMVSYTRTPYHEAVKRAKKQDKALAWAVKSLVASAIGVGGYFLYKHYNPPKSNL